MIGIAFRKYVKVLSAIKDWWILRAALQICRKRSSNTATLRTKPRLSSAMLLPQANSHLLHVFAVVPCPCPLSWEFVHVCGYYSSIASIWGAASIQIDNYGMWSTEHIHYSCKLRGVFLFNNIMTADQSLLGSNVVGAKPLPSSSLPWNKPFFNVNTIAANFVVLEALQSQIVCAVLARREGEVLGM